MGKGATMDDQTADRRRGRAGGVDRAGRGAARAMGFTQAPWVAAQPSFAPLTLLSEEAIQRIHDTSMTILEEIGIDLMSPAMRALAADHCARVTQSEARVHFPREVVTHFLTFCPPSFTIHAGQPAHDIAITPGLTHWGSVASPPAVTGLGRPKRDGNQADLRDFIRLGHQLNAIHFFGGYPVEPLELPAPTRHLDCIRDYLTLTDKVFHPYCLGATRIRDALELVRIARGMSEEELAQRPQCWTVVNSSSPLRYEAAMLDGMIEMARARQPICLTPFTLAGAMAPITLAGALAQQNAEALAGIVLVQMIAPGCPVLYGAYTSNVDMASGAPAMGTPEYFKCAVASGQLARFYGIPYRSSGGNASNAVDAQAVYETAISLFAAKLGGANMVMHSAGWLEGGLCASFEKMVIDVEILQGLDAASQPIEVTDATLALDAIREVGPGGHYFGPAHTLERYEAAFYKPLLSDWRNYGSWTAAGSPDAFTRAEGLARRLIDLHEPPPLDPARAEAMEAFIQRRKAEGGALDT